jgi:hypothetical protein
MRTALGPKNFPVLPLNQQKFPLNLVVGIFLRFIKNLRVVIEIIYFVLASPPRGTEKS